MEGGDDPRRQPEDGARRLRVVRVLANAERLLPRVRGSGPPFPMWLSKAAFPPDEVLEKAVWVGDVPNEGPLVGRACCCGIITPALVRERIDCAVAGCRGHGHLVFIFELLVVLRGSVDWVAASDGDAPAYGFPVGLTADDETVYVGRVHSGGRWRMGRLLPSEGVCRVREEHNKEELLFNEYEVLVVKP